MFSDLVLPDREERRWEKIAECAIENVGKCFADKDSDCKDCSEYEAGQKRKEELCVIMLWKYAKMR